MKKSKKTKIKISLKEANAILQKEFSDIKGNKIQININFAPHPINEPTFTWQRKYDNKKAEAEKR